MKTKTILILSFAAVAVAFGIATSFGDNKKVNLKAIDTNPKNLYLENSTTKVCQAYLIDQANKTESLSSSQEVEIYKHDPVCQAGVFLPNKSGFISCTFCGRSQETPAGE